MAGNRINSVPGAWSDCLSTGRCQKASDRGNRRWKVQDGNANHLRLALHRTVRVPGSLVPVVLRHRALVHCGPHLIHGAEEFIWPKKS